MECPICVESLKKPVTCICNYSACSCCTKRYLLETQQDAQCMNCHRLWSREFLLQYLPRSWINNTYKQHREDLLFERERGMMPATQNIIEQRKLETRRRNEQRQLQGRITHLRSQMRDLLYESGLGGVIKTTLSAARAKKMSSDTLVQYRRLENELNQCFVQQRAQFSQAAVPMQKRLIRPCPKDGCMGFIKCDWSCGICQTKICQQCHSLDTSTQHVCNEDDIRTAEMIVRETKPCPNCAVPTFKIEGCSQMWCTQCHKAWNWQTGALENGNIHNPHYYEWMRNQQHGGAPPREHMDIPRGGFPDMGLILRVAGIPPLHNIYTAFDTIIRFVTHVWETQAIRYRPNAMDNNLELRIDYMENRINEDTFKKMLQRSEKQNKKYQDYYNICTAFRDASLDIFDKIKTTHRYADILKDWCKLWRFIEQSMNKTAAIYDVSVPQWVEFCNKHVIGLIHA
jgi:hypothetical protein